MQQKPHAQRPMPWLTILGAAAVLPALCGGQAQAATLIFEDQFSSTHASFTNNQTFDSDSTNTGDVSGFWTAHLGNSTTIGSMAGGSLTLSATTDAGSNPTVRPVTSVTSAVGSSFQFFSQDLIFAATGLAVGGTTANSYDKVMRFGLISDGVSSFAAASGIVLDIGANNRVSLHSKAGAPQTGGAALVNNALISGAVTGFELTLGATSYTLNILTGSGTTTFTGNHGLTAAAWGNGGQNAMILEVQRASNGAAAVGTTATMSISQLTVSAVPEPSALGLMTLGGMVVAMRRP